MILTVASGMGGTGKTTVSVNLARVFGGEVQLLDCDVEEPNIHLFIKGSPPSEEDVEIPVPEVDETLCDGCGECGKFCAFHAIVSFESKPLMFPGMRPGCGGCAQVCPRGAIREKGHRIGVVGTARADRIALIRGKGVPSSPTATWTRPTCILSFLPGSKGAAGSGAETWR